MTEALSRDATRDRLLEAAARLFAARGFQAVGVREICQEARANVAAVSYWFQGKEGLYREVVARAYERVGGLEGMPRFADHADEPESGFRAWLEWKLRRLLDPARDATFSELIHHELRAPSPLFPEIVARFLAPIFGEERRFLAALTGREEDALEVGAISAAVMGQGIVFRLARPAVAALGAVPSAPSPEEIDAIVDRLVDLTLHGVLGADRGEEGA